MSGSGESWLHLAPVGGSGVAGLRLPGRGRLGCLGGSLRLLGSGRLGSGRLGGKLGLGVAPVRVLLHVLGQVGLLRVGLAAELADVGLQVFGLLVLGYVVKQRVLVDEALVAGVALVRLVCLVASADSKTRSLGHKHWPIGIL